MKKDIHPEYVDAVIHCSCGNSWTTRSTTAEMRIEVCSDCHPFYTGEQRIVDTAGRIERFRRRYAGAEQQREQTAADAANGGDAEQPDETTAETAAAETATPGTASEATAE